MMKRPHGGEVLGLKLTDFDLRTGASMVHDV
jgi:hypothetical protein